MKRKEPTTPERSRKGRGETLLHAPTQHEEGAARASTCIWCDTKISKAGGSVNINSFLDSEAADAVHLRFNGRMMHLTCADKRKHFYQRCKLGLAAHEKVD